MFCCSWRISKQDQDTKCIHQCGNVTIPYPFGIGPDHCFLDPYFAVSCNASIPFLNKLNLEILEVRKSSNSVIVKIPSVTACGDTEIRWNSPNLYGARNLFYGDSNVFVSVGCHGYALLYDSFGKMYGCTSVCSPHQNDSNSTSSAEMIDQCYGYTNCCRIHLSVYGNYRITVSVQNGAGHCRSAFYTSPEFLATVTSTIPPISAFPVMLEWRPKYPGIVISFSFLSIVYLSQLILK